MDLENINYNNEKYYYIDEQECKYGIFYKFASINNNYIFCTKNNNQYEVVSDKKVLKELKKDLKKFEIKDIV